MAKKNTPVLFPKKRVFEIFEIGDKKQLFIDERFIAASRNIALTVNPPRQTGPVIVPDRPWEHYIGFCVSAVRHEGLYKMWYQFEGPVCYATSEDGIRWEKPELGQRDFRDSKKNNMLSVIDAGENCVFLDPAAAPGGRFKLMASQYLDSSLKGGVYVSCSPDGIRWRKPVRVFPFFPDTHNVAFYDTRLKKYVIYLRAWASGKRAVARLETRDIMKPWHYSPDDTPLHLWGKDKSPTVTTQAQVVFKADGSDPPDVDFYTPVTEQYPWADNAYFMFPSPYLHLPGPPAGRYASDGLLDISLLASRDGIKWNRISRKPYLPLDVVSGRNLKMLYMGTGMIREGDEIVQYYGGYEVSHGVVPLPKNSGSIFRTVQRLDGFVSADADYSGGEFITPPLIFKGNCLNLNISVAVTGSAGIGISDAAGNHLPGYSPEDCDPVRGNSLAGTVTWKGNPEIGFLAGRPVRLRFVMRNAKLFAFQFRQQEEKSFP